MLKILFTQKLHFFKQRFQRANFQSKQALAYVGILFDKCVLVYHFSIFFAKNIEIYLGYKSNSITPQPTGKTKQKILNALLDIYENWKNKLDKLGQPYYLKVWLFEPRFSQSQVVCAIGENINFYENTFYKPDIDKIIQLDNYGSLKTKLSKLNWDYRLDEDHYDNTEVGEPDIYASIRDYDETRIWFNKLLKKPHRACKLKESISDVTESYSFKRGDIWLGGQK